MGQERAGKGRKRKMASTWRHPAASPSPTPGRLAGCAKAVRKGVPTQRDAEDRRMKRMEDLTYCVSYLAAERFGAKKARETVATLEGDEHALFEAYRTLANVREPMPATDKFFAVQDRMLQGLIAEAGILDASTLSRTPLDGRLSFWRGDITTLAADVVVNAANSRLLGCWVPGHHCIDNAIHTYSGVQLRAECARIMEKQGAEEPTGMAKITSAYNLPCKRIIHTVGPIANGNPTDLHRTQLASCYTNCLNLAASEDLASIAFCCISTGAFGFPQREAAQIAIRTVTEWLGTHGGEMCVVFNVFLESDERIYKELLGL